MVNKVFAQSLEFGRGSERRKVECFTISSDVIYDQDTYLL